MFLHRYLIGITSSKKLDELIISVCTQKIFCNITVTVVLVVV